MCGGQLSPAMDSVCVFLCVGLQTDFQLGFVLQSISPLGFFPLHVTGLMKTTLLDHFSLGPYKESVLFHAVFDAPRQLEKLKAGKSYVESLQVADVQV